MVASKETILNWLSPQGSLQRVQTEMFISCLLKKNDYLCILKTIAWQLASNQPKSRSWLRYFPIGHWQVLVHSQILGATKNKVSYLDNYSDLRDNRKLGLGCIIVFIFYKRPFLQDWEKWLFYLIHRNQHRGWEKGKKQRNMPQIKDEDKNLRKRP